MSSVRVLKRLRENYYLSTVVSAVARPIDTLCRALSQRIRQTVRKNGASVRLPNGRWMRFEKNSGVSVASLLFWGGLDAYEPDTSRTLRYFFEKASAFVDVGANCGLYSILGPLWNPNVKVLAFEPVPEIHDALIRNLERNEVNEQVSAYRMALSDVTGKASLYLPSSDGIDCETTGTLVTDGWQTRQHAPAIVVETIRFDDFEMTNPTRIDLVKIDVEDHEAAVLAGMEQTIRRDRPFIVIEILPRPHRNAKTCQIVSSLGYTPFWITSCGYIRVSDFDFEHPSSQDFLLSPVSLPGEVITNLEPFWRLRPEQVNRATATTV